MARQAEQNSEELNYSSSVPVTTEDDDDLLHSLSNDIMVCFNTAVEWPVNDFGLRCATTTIVNNKTVGQVVSLFLTFNCLMNRHENTVYSVQSASNWKVIRDSEAGRRVTRWGKVTRTWPMSSG